MQVNLKKWPVTFNLFFKIQLFIIHFSCHLLMPEIKRSREKKMRNTDENMTFMRSCKSITFAHTILERKTEKLTYRDVL